MKTKPEYGWIIENGGILVYPTLCTTRKGCIAQYVEDHRPLVNSWEEIKGVCNNRCVKVEIRRAAK